MNNESVLFKLNADKINHNDFFSDFIMAQADFVDVAIVIIYLILQISFNNLELGPISYFPLIGWTF